MASTRRLRANSSSTRFYWHELWFWKGYYSTPVTPVLSRGLKSLHPYSHSMFLKVPSETQNPKISQCNPAFVFFCLPILGSWHQKLAHSQEDLISQGSVHQQPATTPPLVLQKITSTFWILLGAFATLQNLQEPNQTQPMRVPVFNFSKSHWSTLSLTHAIQLLELSQGISRIAMQDYEQNSLYQAWKPMAGRMNDMYLSSIFWYFLFHLFHVIAHKDRAMPRLCRSLSALAVWPVILRILVHVISSPLQLALLRPPAKSTAVTSKVQWPECSLDTSTKLKWPYWPFCNYHTSHFNQYSQKNYCIII